MTVSGVDECSYATLFIWDQFMCQTGELREKINSFNENLSNETQYELY